MKFTKTTIAAAAAAAGPKEAIFWDDELPGFGIRCQNKRARFCVQFKIGGQQRRMSLGNTNKVTLDNARKAAREYFAEVAKRIDPTVTRAKAETAASQLFGDAIEQFIPFQQAKGRSKSHLDQTTKTLRERCRGLHGLPVASIERGNLAVILSGIAKNIGKTAADRSRAHLSKFFNWAIGDALCSINPCDHLNRYTEEETKTTEHALTYVQVKKIWNALETDHFGLIIKLLILTGQRRTEIGSLRWSEVDIDEAIIHLPGSRTKNKLPHDIPLSRAALAILKSVEHTDRKFVFGEGAGGYSGWSKSKVELDERCGVTGWRLHDLRHTFSTRSEDVDALPYIVEATLNHVTGEAKKGVAGIYNHAKYNKQKREVLDKWAKHITEIVGPTKPGLKLVA